MKTTFEIAALEAAIGPRGSAVLSGAEARSKVRNWLQANGCSREAVASLSMDRLREIYNDPSGVKLAEFRAYWMPPAAPAAPAAPAPASPDVEGLLGTLRGLLTHQPKAGVDEAAVRGIVEPLVDSVEDKVAALAEGIKPLANLAERVKTDASAAARLPLVAAAASGNHILDKLLPFYKPGNDQLVKVVVTAPPSFGKSHSIRLLGKSYDLLMEHGCSEDVDEVATLLGNPIPDGSGGFIVVDGILTEAVRQAATGKNVLVFFDEVFRLHPKAQEWLLTFLTGVKTPDGGAYRLRTRRADSGKLEVLECKAKHLHIIAASNLGLARPVEAFWSRWFKVRLDWNLADCTAVASAILASFGITASPSFAERYAKLINTSRQACKEGRINYPVDFRLLESACSCAATADEAGVGDFVTKHLNSQIAGWDGDLGDTDPNVAALTAPWFKELTKV